MPIEKQIPSLQNTYSPEIDTHNWANWIVQQSIARGYDDLANGRVRPWKQAKAEADRIRSLNQASPM